MRTPGYASKGFNGSKSTVIPRLMAWEQISRKAPRKLLRRVLTGSFGKGSSGAGNLDLGYDPAASRGDRRRRSRIQSGLRHPSQLRRDESGRTCYRGAALLASAGITCCEVDIDVGTAIASMVSWGLQDGRRQVLAGGRRR